MKSNTPSKVETILRMRSTEQLVEDFIATNTVKDQQIFTVRGWILDELERRNPVGFSAWLSLDCPLDEDLRDYIHRR